MLKHVTGSPLQPGACEAGDVLNGYGIKQFEDGAIYAGDFVNGQRSGSGVQRWLDGHVYVGDWCQDVRCGRGLYRFSHGDKDGSGYIEDNECDRYEGEWQSGKFHGQGMCSFASFCFGGEPSRVDMIHASAAAAWARCASSSSAYRPEDGSIPYDCRFCSAFRRPWSIA